MGRCFVADVYRTQPREIDTPRVLAVDKPYRRFQINEQNNMLVISRSCVPTIGAKDEWNYGKDRDRTSRNTRRRMLSSISIFAERKSNSWKLLWVVECKEVESSLELPKESLK